MSDIKPITFTDAEQLKLQELEAQAQEYANWRNSVARSLYAGQDSQLVARLIQFLQHMAVQASKQIEEIRKTAEGRSKETTKADIKLDTNAKAN